MQTTFDFLKKLSKNNNREWFQANKSTYQASHEEMIGFADELLDEMNKHDVIETSSGKKSLNRIYRDIRFKKDKTPYKNHWGGGLYRAGAERRGSYYYHISPQGSFVMGGFFGPESHDLLHIRKQLDQDAGFLREILESKAFKKSFGQLLGSQLKTAPRGFDKDHPDVDLLRYKQFMVRKDFTKDQVMRKDFHKIVSDSFKEMRPFFDCMTEMLTTDLNGISLIK